MYDGTYAYTVSCIHVLAMNGLGFFFIVASFVCQFSESSRKLKAGAAQYPNTF